MAEDQQKVQGGQGGGETGAAKRRSSEQDEPDEDPLVIDEEKPAEAEEDGNDEENEKEFEPTVDMIMNEFDDERTIEEEETLAQEDEAEELDALKEEQNLPIEELLKMYGMAPKQPDEEPKQVEEDGGNTKSESDTEEPVEPIELEEPVAEQPEAELSKGEKRARAGSPGVPPVSKKARSELAKFYEATVEGRSLRSSAGGGAGEEEEEDSGAEGEEGGEEAGKDFSWKKTIMIGPSYQATVPSGLSDYDDSPPYENEDKQVWDPTRLSEEASREYLARAAETQGAVGLCGVNGIPNGAHIRDDEQALLLLLQCGYNTEEALRRKRMNAVPPADTMSLWSEEECRAFETGLRVYGKDFHNIQNQKVGTRSVGELVQFYYLWKKTERHDVFANSFRIEKKKYTLHPGTTDYMERFIDEQEGGRDRSASPNYHSLIYGVDNGGKKKGGLLGSSEQVPHSSANNGAEDSEGSKMETLTETISSLASGSDGYPVSVAPL